MFSNLTAHRAGTFLASFLFATVLVGSDSQASVIVGLLLNPVSTAGGGAMSTRSGAGSWQLYALDDSNTDFGISSYNITMSGTTAINHRSPRTTINDVNGDPQTAGFSLLRTGTNVNPIQASQALPDEQQAFRRGPNPGHVRPPGTPADIFCFSGICRLHPGQLPASPRAWSELP